MRSFSCTRLPSNADRSTRVPIALTGHYTVALLVSGGVALVGVIAWLIVTPAVRPIEWIIHERGTSGTEAIIRPQTGTT